jgi:hypothetical protein
MAQFLAAFGILWYIFYIVGAGIAITTRLFFRFWRFPGFYEGGAIGLAAIWLLLSFIAVPEPYDWEYKNGQILMTEAPAANTTIYGRWKRYKMRDADLDHKIRLIGPQDGTNKKFTFESSITPYGEVGENVDLYKDTITMSRRSGTSWGEVINYWAIAGFIYLNGLCGFVLAQGKAILCKNNN